MNGDLVFSDLADAMAPEWPVDNQTGAFIEPGYVWKQPKAHHAVIFECLAPQQNETDENGLGGGFRFFRVLQIICRQHERQALSIQGFELYGR